jgi:hypothetical protein
MRNVTKNFNDEKHKIAPPLSFPLVEGDYRG